jgi:hypothetical protein
MHFALRVTLIEADVVVKTFTADRADHATSERIERTSFGMLETMLSVNYRTLDFPMRLVFLVVTVVCLVGQGQSSYQVPGLCREY